MDDPIVLEVRKVRDGHARRFDYDLASICADIRQHQNQCGHQVVRLTANTNNKVHLTVHPPA